MDQTTEVNINTISSGTVADVEAALGFLEVDDNLMPTPEALTTHEIGRAFYQLGKLHYDKSDLVKAEMKTPTPYSCSRIGACKAGTICISVELISLDI